MRWTVSEQWYAVIEIVVAGLGAVLTAWASHSHGLGWGIGSAIAFVIVLACRRFVLQTREEKRQANLPTNKALTQQQYDDLEKPDEETLYLIVPESRDKER